jgi:hypothetical protein
LNEMASVSTLSPNVVVEDDLPFIKAPSRIA